MFKINKFSPTHAGLLRTATLRDWEMLKKTSYYYQVKD